MIIVIPGTDSSGKQVATKIVDFGLLWGFVYVQVQGPGTVFLAATQGELLAPASGGILNGMQINANTNLTAPVPLKWVGQLWATSSGGSVAPVAMDVQILPQGGQA